MIVESKAPPLIKAEEEVYLEGPKPRMFELKFAWEVFTEFLKSFRALHFMGPGITVFGSARFREGHPYYEQAEEFGRRIAGMGFVTLTGGGPGLMEAANKGAYEAGGKSVGINIILPHEQHPNRYVHKHITMKYFFTRKVLLVKYSYAFIILPGGFGTMDELFETLTLIQTKTIHHFPVVLFGRRYFEPLMELITFMEKEKTVSPDDMKLVLLTDDYDEAMQHIRKYISSNYTIRPRMKRKWWMLEPR